MTHDEAVLALARFGAQMIDRDRTKDGRLEMGFESMARARRAGILAGNQLRDDIAAAVDRLLSEEVAGG